MPVRARKILLVDDDVKLREAVASSIHDLGVEVIEARDGQEGLEHLAEGAPLPSAILLDLSMHCREGDCLLEALRREPRLSAIPVITMTGGADPAPGVPGASRLHKPFDVDDLARILVSLCDD